MTIGVKISQMTTAASIAAGDLAPVVSSGTNKKFDLGTKIASIDAATAANATALAGKADTSALTSGLALKTNIADLAASGGSALAGFTQTGTGAATRTVQAKLRDMLSSADFDTIANGAAALTSGGALDVVAVSANGQQFFAPARGNVHHFDAATIGTTDLITNGTFTGSPATGWTLSNFTSNNPGLTHTAGSAASALRSVTVQASTNHLIKVTLNTTTAGGITLYVNGTALLSNVDFFGAPVVGSVTYTFPYLNTGSTGSINIEFRSDALWAGSLTKLEVIQPTRETPYDYFSIASDKRDFVNNFGIKFGRYLSGNMSMGDRATGAYLSATASWNVLLGSRAGSVMIDTIECTLVGALAGEYNQANQITAGGYSAFRCNTTGTFNAGWGFKTFGLNSTGSRNSGLGYFAGYGCSIGNDNTAVGYQTLYQGGTGSFNTSVGSMAGAQLKDGTGNTYLGAISGPYNAGAFTYTYSNQTLVGAESKAYGNQNTAVGESAQCGTDPNAAGAAITNAVAIGYQAASIADNQITLGNTSVTTLRTAATITGSYNTAVPAGGNAAVGLKVSSTANLGFFVGSGAPTLSAAKGSIYSRTDGSSTSTRLYVNTDGATTWTNVVTAA